MKLPTIANLIKCYKLAKLHPDAEIIKCDWCTTFTGNEFIAWFRSRLHQKINRNLPKHNWRKLTDQWQIEAQRTARAINSRFVIHWLPQEFRKRFAHRLNEI